MFRNITKYIKVYIAKPSLITLLSLVILNHFLLYGKSIHIKCMAAWWKDGRMDRWLNVVFIIQNEFIPR